MGMDPDSGKIYTFDSKESLVVAQQKREQEKQKALLELSQAQAEFLRNWPEHERPQLHHDLMSKNNSAKRRARRKIAKASRQRNRK